MLCKNRKQDFDRVTSLQFRRFAPWPGRQKLLKEWLKLHVLHRPMRFVRVEQQKIRVSRNLYPGAGMPQ